MSLLDKIRNISNKGSETKYVTLLGLDSFAKFLMTYYNNLLKLKLNKDEKTSHSDIESMLDRIKK